MANIVRVGGGGVPTTRLKTADTQAENVLENTKFVDINGVVQNGAMVDHGSSGYSNLTAGQELYIAEGYYNGNGRITVQSLNGNADPQNVLSGKTFYNSSHTRQTGTMANHSNDEDQTLNPGDHYMIPVGYHSGAHKVSAREINSSDVGTPLAREYANEVSNTATNRSFSISAVNGGVYVVTVSLLEYYSYGSTSITVEEGATVVNSQDILSASDGTSMVHSRVFVLVATASSIKFHIGKGRKCVYTVVKIG